MCAQKTLKDTNELGANVHFDLCSDDKASMAFFGKSGQKLAAGTATQVSCNVWSDTADVRQYM
jgi:hypothetical protein